MKKLCLWLFSLFLVATLFGCSGGGGGGSGGLTTNLFIDWSSVDPPENVAMTGISQDTEYDADPEALQPFDIKEVSKDSTARIRYSADGTIERIDVITPHVALSWNEAAGDTITDAGGDPWVIATDSAETEIGILFNPLEMDPADAWEYQTFGAWATDRGLGSGEIGAISVGTPTPDNVISGLEILDEDVTFTGHSAGIYINQDGSAAYRTESAFSVDVNFSSRELNIRTTGTTLIDLETNDPWIDNPPELSMTGTLRYDPGINDFSGDVFAAGIKTLEGQSTGQFYGPAAEELGGVFSLSDPEGTTLEFYSGAYGAAVQPIVP